MPSPPARSIATYFSKLPTSPTASSSKPKSSRPPSSPTAKTATTTTTSVTQTPNGSLEKRTITTSQSTLSPTQPSSSPSTSTLTGSVKRTAGGLSDAARKAIAEGVEDGNKRQKVAAPVADVFLKVTKPAAAVALPKASTREELRTSLAEQETLKELLALELDTMGEDWLLALQDEFTKSYFQQLKTFVTNEQKSKKVFPPAEDIYSWSRLCPLRDVRVVIIGQDPYHGVGQAHGLAFSVRKGITVPPSLKNIYKEMADEIPQFTIPKHGDLTEWAKHGVLLLNTSLTVRAHEAGSHAGKGWETFTAAVMKVITSRLAASSNGDSVPGAKGVVFMAWGAHAQKMCAGIDQKKHLLLKSAHPSPFAAHKGFFGNGHFKKANAWLEERYGEEGGINWKVLGAES